ncbi:conserved hypothetical protein [Pediculus humanus corporis]|uniref:Armadillo repeat-containing protein 1 n=1 Tax=Pediculus humanus subsp. corporis TaxID=121224 RepID=E0VYV9_PEDHC|nr:uncharacterized protein Phum_PHUM520910 [Pediculus humanus corporis]EEB18565.1 conserved hypothetical protein [Pediculus humanus corporis]
MNNTNLDPLTPLSAVQKYKELAKNPENHSEIVKDKTAINFLTYVLDTSDEEVLLTSLDTLLLLSDTNSNIDKIRSTFGVTEAVNLILNRKDVKNVDIKDKAKNLLEKLKNSNNSNNKNTGQKCQNNKNKKVLTLYINGLHLETRVLSVIIDVEHQKCTMTVFDHIDPKTIATIISENTDMEAQLISKNKNNQEILVPLIDNDKTLDLEDLPPYLDEKDSPVKEKAVRSAKDIRIAASEWFCSAAGFLQRTFYW